MKIKEIIFLLFVFLLTILICLFIFNLILDIWYQEKFLMTPCDLCIELNPHLETCIYPNKKVFERKNITDINFTTVNFWNKDSG